MSANNSKYWLVMPAAGSGSRMQASTPKQYLSIRGQAIIEHTLSVFIESRKFEQIMVCVPIGDSHFETLAMASHALVSTIAGGESRAQSVLNGLSAIDASDDDWVLVHDAARPCLSAELLDSLIQQLDDDEIGGILAIPAKDTLKQSSSSQHIAATLDRSTIWQAQTPQMFRYGRLKMALTNALQQGVEITDEASALEWAGYAPRLIEGDARNLKVTTPEDLVLAEFLLERKPSTM